MREQDHHPQNVVLTLDAAEAGVLLGIIRGQNKQFTGAMDAGFSQTQSDKKRAEFAEVIEITTTLERKLFEALPLQTQRLVTE